MLELENFDSLQAIVDRLKTESKKAKHPERTKQGTKNGFLV